jgi:hypothetical protein
MQHLRGFEVSVDCKGFGIEARGRGGTGVRATAQKGGAEGWDGLRASRGMIAWNVYYVNSNYGAVLFECGRIDTVGKVTSGE